MASTTSAVSSLKNHYFREEYDFVNTSEAFTPQHRYYSQQYCSLYFVRLCALKGAVYAKAAKKWETPLSDGTVAFAEYLRDAPRSGLCILIGTLYKEMLLKPSILQAYSEGVDLQKPLVRAVSDDDYLIIEDHSGRLRLRSDVMVPNKLVSGLVTAVFGHLEKDGVFLVLDYCFGGVPSLPMLPLSSVKTHSPLYVAFVSGLSIGDASVHPNNLQLLKAFLVGSCGGEAELKLSSQVVRLIVAGNALSAVDKDMRVLEEVDAFFAEIAPFLDIDVMPGAEDPTTFSLPQKPLHPALFQHSRRLSTFTSIPNPYSFTINNVQFLGSSGQAVDNICAFSSLQPLEALALTAESRCIAPTAPDTLPCYPFIESDPFCLPEDSKFPHVLFCGNQEDVQYKWIASDNGVSTTDPKSTCEKAGDVLIVTIPDFSKNPTLVLVELYTREVVTINFSSF